MKRTLLLVIFNVVFYWAYSQQLTTSNLPIIIINTNGQYIQPDVKITADMGIVYNGEGVANSISNPFNHYYGKIGIEIRGQSSQGFPMNSYNVELRDEQGNEKNSSLFGMPEESDWVLYAPYTDKTLMHNFLAYTFSNEMGHWASHCRFVEVQIDGDYKGIYVFMEKIKRTAGRLNLATLNAYDTTGDQLTGGYIFSIDKQPNGWFSTHPVPNSIDNGTRQYSYVYPKLDSIQPAQKVYIKSAVDSFEDVAASDYFQDPEKGLNKYIDYSSFVDYFIIDEVSRNVDGYRLSTYFHKNKNSKNHKIFAGPVWDYDIAFHNADYCNGSLTTGWALDFNYDCVSYAGGAIPFFWYRMAREDSIFKNMLYCHWNNYRKTVLSETHIFHIIDSIVKLTAEARTRHFTRWPILGVYIWPNPQPIPADYPGEINQLKQWLHERLAWLDRNMPQNGNCWPPGATGTFMAQVFPNPMLTNSAIKIKSVQEQMIYLQVFDSQGRLIHSRQKKVFEGDNYIYNLNTSSWPSGVYFMRCTGSKGESYTQKLVK